MVTLAIARADETISLVASGKLEIIRQQIEILDWRLAGKKADKIDDPAAWAEVERQANEFIAEVFA